MPNDNNLNNHLDRETSAQSDTYKSDDLNQNAVTFHMEPEFVQANPDELPGSSASSPRLAVSFVDRFSSTLRHFFSSHWQPTSSAEQLLNSKDSDAVARHPLSEQKFQEDSKDSKGSIEQKKNQVDAKSAPKPEAKASLSEQKTQEDSKGSKDSIEQKKNQMDAKSASKPESNSPLSEQKSPESKDSKDSNEHKTKPVDAKSIPRSAAESPSATRFTNSKDRSAAKSFLGKVEKYITHSRKDGKVVFSTDPCLMKKILQSLGLDAFKTDDKNFEQFLKKITSEPVDITPLLKKIKEDIVNNPPLCKLLAQIKAKNLISDDELEKYKETLQLQVHLLCLFEAFTVTMVNSPRLAIDVYKHIIQRRGINNPGNPLKNFFFATPFNSGLFIRLKLISIDPGMLNFIFHKLVPDVDKQETQQDLDDFIKEFKLAGVNASLLEAHHFGNGEFNLETLAGMGLNILEAAWEDSTSPSKNIGGRENAEAGFSAIAIMEALAELKRGGNDYYNHYNITDYIVPKGVSLDMKSSDNALKPYPLIPALFVDTSRKKVSHFRIDEPWLELYNPWNCRFVTQNLNSILLPLKLLIPSILGAEAHNFKEARVVSLFFFGNLFLQEIAIKHNPLFQPSFKFNNADEMLTIFGQTNKAYAELILKQLCPELPRTPKELWHEAFGSERVATFRFVKTLREFTRTENNRFRQFKSLDPQYEDKAKQGRGNEKNVTNILSII